MWLLTKELAEAVIEFHMDEETGQCQGCGAGLVKADRRYDEKGKLIHEAECIVTRAKLLLDVEYGVKSKP